MNDKHEWFWRTTLSSLPSTEVLEESEFILPILNATPLKYLKNTSKEKIAHQRRQRARSADRGTSDVLRRESLQYVKYI